MRCTRAPSARQSRGYGSGGSWSTWIVFFFCSIPRRGLWWSERGNPKLHIDRSPAHRIIGELQTNQLGSSPTLRPFFNPLVSIEKKPLHLAHLWQEGNPVALCDESLHGGGVEFRRNAQDGKCPRTIRSRARGKQQRTAPRLGTPNVPEVSAKTNSGTGEPDEDWLIRREMLASAGRLRNASRVILKKASNLRAEDCSVMTDLDVSSAAMEME
jgi:hypothetical protein